MTSVTGKIDAAPALLGTCPLVSVVIPAYNVENYLAACLDSVLAQRYRPLEIVVVDDGSTDSTGSICDEYAQKNTCIRVIHQTNGGLSAARNAGIDVAKGSYIALVDSDDVVAPAFVSTLVAVCEESGCAIAALRIAKRFNENDDPGLPDKEASDVGFCVQTSEAYLLDILNHRADMGAQFRLYASDLFARERFTEGILFEDFDVTYRLLHRTERVAVLDEPGLYGYRVRRKSIIGGTYSHEKLRSMSEVSERFLDSVAVRWPEVETAAQAYCFTVFRMIFAQIPPHHEDEGPCWDRLKTFRYATLVDSDARLADRMTAFLSYAGKVPFRGFCMLARRLGVMR